LKLSRFLDSFAAFLRRVEIRFHIAICCSSLAQYSSSDGAFERGMSAFGFVEFPPIVDDVPNAGVVADFFKYMAFRFNIRDRWLKTAFSAPASVVNRKRVGRRVTAF